MLRSSAEQVSAVLVVLTTALALYSFIDRGYLPQPFYFHPDESLMDLFSTSYWAHRGGAYTTWRSIYPPLSFVFLKTFSMSHCYAGSGMAARTCDSVLLNVFVLTFIGNVVLVYANYRRAFREGASTRTIAVCLGLPMLYALERGNLLIPCFTCFVLAFGDLLSWRFGRWLAMALAINFKPYLVFSVLPFVGRRAYWGLILCGLLFVTIYGLTYLAEGSGSPLEVIDNESRYAAMKSAKYFSDIYFATSYWPLIRLLRAAPAGLVLVEPAVAQAISLGLEILIRVSQVAFFSCCAVAVVRPHAVDVRRFGAMVACISLTAFTTGSAGYVQIFLFFLLFYEPWCGPTRIVILTCAYLLCLPVDYVFLPVVHDHAVSFLSGRAVVTRFGLSVGQLLRPGLLMVIQFGLIVINLRDLLSPGAVSGVWFSTARPESGSRPAGRPANA